MRQEYLFTHVRQYVPTVFQDFASETSQAEYCSLSCRNDKYMASTHVHEQRCVIYLFLLFYIHGNTHGPFLYPTNRLTAEILSTIRMWGELRYAFL